MGNKIIKKSLTHYYDEYSSQPTQPFTPPPEPDKSKSISELNQQELRDMISRVGAERELQSIIKELKRNANEEDSFEKPFKVDVTTPIDQLYHHGIIGMRWGRRRYQNEDGSRTRLGKQQDRTSGRDKRAEEYKKTTEAKKKGTQRLSNDDLKKINERLMLEQTYKKLTQADRAKSESWVKNSIQKAAEGALSDFTKGVFLGSAKLLVKNLSPEFAEAAFSMKQDTSKPDAPKPDAPKTKK